MNSLPSVVFDRKAAKSARSRSEDAGIWSNRCFLGSLELRVWDERLQQSLEASRCILWCSGRCQGKTTWLQACVPSLCRVGRIEFALAAAEEARLLSGRWLIVHGDCVYCNLASSILEEELTIDAGYRSF